MSHVNQMSEGKQFISPLRFACVCASNFNRSMAGHKALANNNFNVSSYGTNSQISISGPKGANLYDFGTTYNEISKSLKGQEDSRGFYESQGIIDMINRNLEIKEKPERFASTFDINSASFKIFDVVFTYQRPIMQKVLLEFLSNGNRSFQLAYVINIETKDDYQNALKSAGITSKIAQKLADIYSQGRDLTEELDSILNDFVRQNNYSLSYHIVSY